MLKNLRRAFLSSSLVLSFLFIAGCSGSTATTQQQEKAAVTSTVPGGINLDTVKAQRFDTGKMWTFDNPPVKYFQEAYGFTATPEWLEKARKSALRFASYCSASFVSSDGLVMTNHHCGRESVTEVTKEGENLHKTGFYAQTLQDERPVPGLYVDQLVLIKDVTKEVQDAINSAKTDAEKVQAKKDKISEIEASTRKETGLEASVVTLYSGGEYSLYGYKRYNDVRLVFAPENQIGFFGGDYDNFTYPRYNLDCTFFRVYDESGKPLKTDNYFKWSPQGASEGEAIFVVGNPGRTNRLNTMSQLEYFRDVQYPATLNLLNDMIAAYSAQLKEHPDQALKYEDILFMLANSQKVYIGMIKGLNDPVLMARKQDFENKFKAAVDAKPELKAKYGNVWDAIAGTRNEMRQYFKDLNAYTINYRFAPEYFTIARDVIAYAKQMQLPEGERSSKYKGADLDSTKAKIFPEKLDKDFSYKLTEVFAKNLINNLGQNNDLVQKLFDSKTGKDAADYMLSHSQLTTKESVMALLNKDPKDILSSDDPFIYFLQATSDKLEALRQKAREIQDKEAVNKQLLGQALFAVYGTSIPPDATFTLRIADGIVKGYDYNGTKAPAKTTYYGLYNRYYEFNKKYPWDLPERWKTIPPEFNLETPFNFVSTNDIIGGNSGSPVINKNLEIVGLAFDGNIESLPGDFIYTTETNRCLSVDSEGMVEAIKDMYKATRLSDELRAGKIVEGTK
ncbi:MAG TPA: S46 family peptidase [Ignavibacteriales bacterium]|nr:S46 family peptidase [Ignavibacteriales bacterium]